MHVQPQPEVSKFNPRKHAAPSSVYQPDSHAEHVNGMLSRRNGRADLLLLTTRLTQLVRTNLGLFGRNALPFGALLDVLVDEGPAREQSDNAEHVEDGRAGTHTDQEEEQTPGISRAACARCLSFRENCGSSSPMTRFLPFR
mgnify:CR=1 FL=1